MTDDNEHHEATPAPLTGGRSVFHHYEITVHGRLGARWAAWFDGFDIVTDAGGDTVLRGAAVDQAALHGVLTKVRDLGLPLISISRVEDENPSNPDAGRT